MNTAKDYLFLSILSYHNFKLEDIGKKLEDLFIKGSSEYDRLIETKDNIFLNMEKTYILDFFSDELKRWQVYHVENRTNKGRNIFTRTSGFYSVSFINDLGDIVISYRGSERYPIEDAYKDFVETDLLIGVGRRPKQFQEGVEVYNDILEMVGEDTDKISLTGHSLGGGIAQFVAMESDRKGLGVPYTCTWNAVGINKKGIIGVDDFVEFEKLIDSIYDFSSEEKIILSHFKDCYLDLVIKELKRVGYIKDRSTIKPRKTYENLSVDNSKAMEFLKTINFDKYRESFNATTKREAFRDYTFIKNLFNNLDIDSLLKRAGEFMDTLEENKKYSKDIVNFCHSKDLTISLFGHIGSVYQIDKRFKIGEVSGGRFIKNILFLTRSIANYHFEDVFIPFLKVSGPKRGVFCTEIDIRYIASLIRKGIHYENKGDAELIKLYYKMVDGRGIERKLLKMFIKVLKNIKEDLLYIDEGIKHLEKLKDEEVVEVWEIVKDKLPSPYEAQDIYDFIINVRCNN